VEQSELNVRSFYETLSRNSDAKDFQRQVGRVVKAGPAGPDQITMIVDAVTRGLDLKPQDVVLDLCCGNGAISHQVFAHCQGGLGVDFTPYLIEIAKANFEQPPHCLYQLSDVLEFVETTQDTERFTKVMCYGSFFCLLEWKALKLLRTLRRRFPNVGRVFLGNQPDLDQADLCFRREWDMESPPFEELKRHDKPWGIWRTEEEMWNLAARSGWRTEISRMPPEFFVAYCRFDAILTVDR
jgi:hypothetical protein